MQNWKTIAHEAKDLLTVCLAKAIDQALTAQTGPAWFAEFMQAESQMKINLRITKPGQMSVQDMDLQALLKFLRFRDSLTRQVLAYHGFFRGLDIIAVDAQMGQLNQLLDRLMVDFRNRIEAHSRAADIAKELQGQDLNRIYGYEEAVQDMHRLARVFATVKDEKGRAYCRRIEDLSKKKTKWWVPVVVALPLVVVAVVGLMWWNNSGGSEENSYYYSDSDPRYVQNEVTIQPIYVRYEGDKLVMDCYIINGTDKDIADLDLSCVTVLQDDSKLAEHNFGSLNLQEKGITLEAKDSITWCFEFSKDAVRVQDATLSDIEVEIQYQAY